MDAIYVLWLRQLKRYIRSRARIVGSIGQPLLFLLAFGFGFGPVYTRAGGGNYLQFLGPGIIAMSIMFTAIFSGIEVIWDRQFGFLKETLVAPVSRISIMIGRTLGGATVSLIQGFIIFFITLLVGFRPDLHLLPWAFAFAVLIAIFFTALGTAIASRLEDMQAFPLIMNFIVMPLFFLSGAIFPVSGLPAGIDTFVKFNPTTYGVDGLRRALTGSSAFSFGHDFAILALVSAGVLVLGGYLFSKIRI